MNGRMELMMHRWSSRLAVGGIALAGLAVVVLQVINDSYPPVQHHKWVDTSIVRDSLHSVVAEVTQVIPALDGDPQTQKAVAQLVEPRDSDYIAELWVINAEGEIVYFGRHQPIWPKIKVLVPQNYQRFLDNMSAELLPPPQRLVLMIAGAIQWNYELSVETLKRWRSFDPEHPKPADRTDEVLKKGYMRLPDEWQRLDLGHQTPSEAMVRSLVDARDSFGGHFWPDRLFVLQPVPGGFIAAVGHTAHDLPPWPEVDPSELLFWRSLDGLFFGIGFAVYWFSLPLWVVTDARRRGEKAVAWGLFTLLGNVVALVLYLLVRREV